MFMIALMQLYIPTQNYSDDIQVNIGTGGKEDFNISTCKYDFRNNKNIKDNYF